MDVGSPAELSGLRAGDSVLEINGKPTNGLPNRAIANLISTAGNEITFLVGRKKGGYNTEDAAIRESAARITQETINEAQSRLQQPDEYNNVTNMLADAPAIPTRRLSRKDSSSPKLIHEEIKMSSSKLHQVGQDAISSSSMSPSPPTYIVTSQQQQVTILLIKKKVQAIINLNN